MNIVVGPDIEHGKKMSHKAMSAANGRAAYRKGDKLQATKEVADNANYVSWVFSFFSSPITCPSIP